MISIIICSRQKDISEELKDNISETIGCDYDLVVIDNSKKRYSIFQAYNEGISKSKGGILCFMHEDVLFRSMAWGSRIVGHFQDDEQVGVIGFAGTHFLPDSPMYWYSSPFISQKNLNKDQGGVKKHFHEDWFSGKSIIEAVAVDGFCFFMKKSVFEQVHFDEKTYGGFHLYDMDICMQAIEAGFKVCVCRDILSEHCWSENKQFSKEGGDLFLKNLTQFTDKWKGKKMLPIWRGLNLPSEMFRRVNRIFKQAYRNTNVSASSLLHQGKKRIKKLFKK